MKTVIFCTITLLTAASTLASAASFEELDVDKDGLISLEEAKADKTISALFAELDSNKDGYLSKIEVATPSE
jgi:Ca2+-binding EF-hand superfamily protein